MERKKKKDHVAELKAYARRARLELKFEDVSSEGPKDIVRFIKKAVLNGHDFPIGVGNDEKEAKQNAAKSALRSLSERENLRPVAENAAKNRAAPVHKRSVPKQNNVRLHNKPGEKNRVPMPLQPVESTNNATHFVAGDQEYPAITAKPTTEAQEEAAKLAHHEKSGNTFTQDRNPVVKAKRRIAEDLPDEDVNIPKGDNTENNTSENTLTQSEISRFTSEFEPLEILGKGGFGRVFVAKEKLTEKNFAVKIVRCKDKKALREVIALSDLLHCNIVRYYTCWLENSGYQWDGAAGSSQSSTDTSPVVPHTNGQCLTYKYLYIQMELCNKTLRVWIDEKNTQNVKKSLRDSKRREESLSIAQQIVSGVKYIHSKMLIHRDLKPANIMFGQDQKVKIGDFGLVTAENDEVAENLVERTVCKGTPSYMAPEQKSETTYDRRVDIFALGLIYFELFWNIPTVHERQEVWGEVRGQKFPEGFSGNFHEEYTIIKPMLCVKPEERPEASTVKTELKERTRRLSFQGIGSKSV